MILHQGTLPGANLHNIYNVSNSGALTLTANISTNIDGLQIKI